MPESQWQSVPNSFPFWVEYESRAEAQKLWLNYVLFQESMEQFSLCKPNSFGIASTYELCISQMSAILSDKTILSTRTNCSLIYYPYYYTTDSMGKSFTVALAAFAATGSFLFGYDSGVMTDVIASPNFLEFFNTTQTSSIIGAINSTFSGGGRLCSFTALICCTDDQKSRHRCSYGRFDN